ncbi:MAG: sulfate ABC transporter permease subunit CysW [Dehalococcoidia bacterium]|nr:sulfate ABC transporter permease subunit CysW [Dehalococcoidia bacterium]
MASHSVGAALPSEEPRQASTSVFAEPAWVRLLLIVVGVGFLGVVVILPVALVFEQAFALGAGFYLDAIRDPDTVSALRLTLTVAAIVVPLNAIFGVAAAWAITKFDFRGKSILITLIDLPLAVSPVVAGLIYVLIFGAQGYIGPWMREHDIRVIFALPGIALATTFVTFPLVARSLIPVMQDVGREYEEAAVSLGASGWRTFWSVTLPQAKWGLLYGIILCNARAMGEFGAVAVVSGKITGKTDTLPLRVEKLDKAFDTTSAFAVASMLVALAVVTLVLKVIVEWRTSDHESGPGSPAREHV